MYTRRIPAKLSQEVLKAREVGTEKQKAGETNGVGVGVGEQILSSTQKQHSHVQLGRHTVGLGKGLVKASHQHLV